MSAKKIVSLADRLENKTHKKQVERYREKVDNIQKIVQCGSCRMRCAMCGLYLNNDDPPSKPFSNSTGLALCESCKCEFDDFLSVSRGGQRSEVFWQNEAWVKMWLAWINYRKAMAAFVESPELKLLMEELKTRS